MFTGSLCLSGNNGYRQVRYVETKTLKLKDDLKVYLQGVLNGNNNLTEIDGIYKAWLSPYFFGKKRLDRGFFQFLVDFFSLKNTLIPTPNGLNELYKQFQEFRTWNESLIVLFTIVSDSNLLNIDSLKEWNRIGIKLNKFTNNHIAPDQTISHFRLLFDKYKEATHYFIDSEIFQSKRFSDLIVSKNTHRLNNILAAINSICTFNFTCTQKPQFQNELIDVLFSYGQQDREDFNFDDFNKDYTCYEKKIAIVDSYLNIYPGQYNYLNQSALFILNNNNSKVLPYLNYVIDFAEKSNKFIDNIICELMSFESEFTNIPISNFRDMFDNLYILTGNSNNMDYLDCNYLFQILNLYNENRSLSVESFNNIDNCHPQPKNRFNFNNNLLGFLFFKYEIPWLLINNIHQFNNTIKNCIRFLITNQRINKYPELSISLSNKETNYFYTKYSKNNTPFFNSSNPIVDSVAYAKFDYMGVDTKVITSIIERHGFIENYEFWERMMPFFIRYDEYLTNNNINEILDFLFANINFNIKGRTWRSMQIIITHWHEELALLKRYPGYKNKRWSKINTPDFSFEIEEIKYSIIQLSESKELLIEGDKQKHCVANYIGDCYDGNCSIWSLRKHTENNTTSLVTIELRNNTIRQARGKYNRETNRLEMSIISVWAESNNLKELSYDLQYL